MFHKFDTITNTAGDSLVGYRIRAREAAVPVGTGAVAPLYADQNGTPIISVSGFADTAISDGEGNYSFFIDDGTYDLEISDTAGVPVKVVSFVPMVGDVSEAMLEARDLARLYAVSDDDAPISGAESEDDRGARYEANRAGTAAATAISASGASQSYRDEAEGFRDEAEVFAQNAADGAEIYADTAAGIAGTVDGEWFKVADADGTTLYKNVAEVATLVNVTPSTQTFDDAMDEINTVVTLVTDDLAEGRMVDPEGFAGLVVDAAGAHAPNIDTLEEQMGEVYPIAGNLNAAGSPLSFAVVDPNGFMAFGADGNEIYSPGYDDTKRRARSAQRKAAAQARLGNELQTILATINHILLYGQSLSIGTEAVPNLTSTATMAWAKMFEGGVRGTDYAAYGGTARNSLVGLHEADTTVSSINYGETFASGCAMVLQQLLLEEDGIDINDLGADFLFSAPGQGSQSVANLTSTGGAPWLRLAADMTAGQTLAQAASSTYLLRAVLWAQGEQSMNLPAGEGIPANYKAAVLALKAQIEAEQATVNGADVELPWITYQNATHNVHSQPPLVPMAHAELAEENDTISLAVIMYIMDYGSGEHVTADSSRLAGAYYGIDLKRWLFDRVKPRHLSTGTPIWMDKGVILPIRDAVGALALDTSRVTGATNYGFTLVDSGGSPLTANAPVIVGQSIQITSPDTIPSGAQLRYAWGTVANGILGRTGDTSGCLRDSQGDEIVFCRGGNFPMHKYLPISAWSKP